MGRRIGHHQRGQRVAVLGRLGAQVGEIDVALLVGLHDHHLHPGHHGAGGVGAVRRQRNEAGDPLGVAPRAMIGADDEQSGELALRAGVGLQRHGGEPGDLGELVFELAEQHLVALRLVQRRERMQPVELAPRHRHHLGRGVQLHGARAERDHRRGEREVARLEPLDVAQHLGLGVVAVEHRMRQVGRAPLQGGRDRALGVRPRLVHHERQRLVQREDGDQVGQIAQGHRFVQRDAEPVGWERPQVDVARPRRVEQARQRPRLDLDAERVEEVLVHELIAQPLQRLGEQPRQGVHPLGDAAQSLGAVVDGVHARHDREQHLRGADVARRLLAADVLLARLQRHAQRGPAGAVLRHADDAAGQVALVRVARGEERGVRAAVAHRHAEPLAVAHGDVGAPLTRRDEQREREQVGRRGDQRAGRVRPLAQGAEVSQPPSVAGYCTSAPITPSPKRNVVRIARPRSRSPRTPARVRTTAIVCG